MKKISIDLKWFIILSLHLILYRIFLFSNFLNGVESELLLKKIVSSCFSESFFALIVVFLGQSIGLVTKSETPKKIYYWSFFLVTYLLNVTNFYVAIYFPDGLANLGILWEYIPHLSVMAKTGVGSADTKPLIFMALPLALVFIFKNYKTIQLLGLKSKIRNLLITALLALVSNQLQLKSRIDKTDLMETNTLIRILKNKGSHSEGLLASIEAGNAKLTEKDISTIQYKNNVTYLSSEYPLMKKDSYKNLNLFNEKPNIVILTLESVGSVNTGIYKLQTGSHSKHVNVTPFINSLMTKSNVYTQAYSNGDNTAAGLTSIFCSIYDPIRPYDGRSSIMRKFYSTNLHCLTDILKEQGYKNYSFNGYHDRFDNKNVFLPKVGFDKIYGRDTIKKETNINSDDHEWGLYDNKVLDHMIRVFDSTTKPFFSIFMSVNTHPPFALPKEYKMNSFDSDPLYNKYLNSLKWTDNSLKKFFKTASTRPWFKNTIFVITADNGNKDIKDDLRKNLTQHQVTQIAQWIPLIFYVPAHEKKFTGINKDIVSQVDIAPTLLHLLGLNTVNHFVGDSLLLERQRDYVYLYNWHANHYLLEKEGFSLLKEGHIKKGPQLFEGQKRTNSTSVNLKSLNTTYNYLLIRNKIWNDSLKDKEL